VFTAHDEGNQPPHGKIFLGEGVTLEIVNDRELRMTVPPGMASRPDTAEMNPEQRVYVMRLVQKPGKKKHVSVDSLKRWKIRIEQEITAVVKATKNNLMSDDEQLVWENQSWTLPTKQGTSGRWIPSKQLGEHSRLCAPPAWILGDKGTVDYTILAIPCNGGTEGPGLPPIPGTVPGDWRAKEWEYNTSWQAKKQQAWIDDSTVELAGDTKWVRRRLWRRLCIRECSKPAETLSIHRMSTTQLEERIANAEDPEERAQLQEAHEKQFLLEHSKQEAIRLGVETVNTSADSLIMINGQIEQTRYVTRRLEAMDAQLSEAERELVKLESNSMFNINTGKKKTVPLPEFPPNIAEFKVNVKRKLWHAATAYCSDAILYLVESKAVHDAFPYRQIKRIRILADSMLHAHSSRIELIFNNVKDTFILSAPKSKGEPQLQLLLSTLASRGRDNAQNISIVFEDPSNKFEVKYISKDSANHREIRVDDDSLRLKEARKGLVRAPDQQGTFENDVYNLMTDVAGIANATGDALHTHMDELNKQKGLAEQLEIRNKGINTRIRSVK